MTQISTNVFKNEIYSKHPKKNFVTNKTEVFHIDDIWSLKRLDLNDHVHENNRGNRYVIVVIDNFSKFGWIVAIRN